MKAKDKRAINFRVLHCPFMFRSGVQLIQLRLSFIVYSLGFWKENLYYISYTPACIFFMYTLPIE